jgi:polysaccharide biosynthesis protein PslH
MLKETHFDLIQLEGLEMGAYLPLIRQHQPSARICYDAHNAEFALQENIYRIDRRTPKRWPAAVYSWLQAGRIARFEREVSRSVDCVIAVSDTDAAALQPFRPQDKIAIVPNGVFTDAYTEDVPRLDLGDNVLVFTGKMDYRPNVDAMLWFSEAIFPLIRQGVPDVKLYIVGQKPHRSLQALRELPGIEITGWVADVQPFLQAADVYIAPLRMGSGTRLKLLEAMATGCAVVATTAAASGLAPQVQNSLTLADDAASFAQNVITLLHNPERRAILGAAAQTDVRRVYDWSALIPTLLSTYEEHGIG